MSRPLQRCLLTGLVLAMLGLFLLGLSGPVLAAPAPQVTGVPTPTPGPDGRIIYIVQPGDSPWRISAITGIPIDEIRRLNNLGTDDVIVAGQELLLGVAEPVDAASTPGATATPESGRPTTSPQPGTGTLCILVYNDTNGDSLHQAAEPAIRDGEISLTDRSGNVSKTETTTGSVDPLCFQDLPEGDYNISVAVPEDYNPTTVLNYALAMEPGSETQVDFGAQPSSEALAEAPAPSGSGKSPLLGILGALILIMGIGLGVYASRLGRSRARPVE